MIARFRQDVANVSPKAVVILGGTNDIAAGVSLNQIEDNLAMIGDLAKAHGIKPVFASILPVSDYHRDADPAFAVTANRPPSTIQAVNQWLKSYCQNQSFVYLDYYAAMVDPAGQLQADLSDDGLHPNSKGYRVMSPIAIEAIGRALGTSAGAEDHSAVKRRARTAQ
jgi:lysophospholipase L1-like esterase